MNGKKIWCALMALGLGIAATSVSSDAFAQKRGKTTKAAAPSAPATAKKEITFDLPGVTWGQTLKQLTATIEKILDEDYKPLYKKVSPGVKMKRLDAALAEEKSSFARSRIDFGKIPNALDSGPLKGEYTYNNGEAMLVLTRKGIKWHFFLIKGNLWKVIAEHKLGEKEPMGKDFTAASVKVSKDLGAPGRVTQADYDKGRNFTEVDWKDKVSHMRLIDRGETLVAIAYESLSTLGILGSLRTGKQPGGNQLDPTVADVTRKDPSPPPGPPAKK